ncbi:uncharacterized protein LOC112538957 [Tetranychus urticae]|uniref:uncharacterized protein LOC112538957 n=1 Tax=Tetranychus urticae TaxID=32264 RepID=UPI000D65CC5B|nr:uncharacterized protein LOC112538957 [Tetranychus urticae]
MANDIAEQQKLIELNKQLIEKFLTYMNNKTPDAEKIKATPICQLKMTVKNIVDILKDKPNLKKVADKHKIKKIINTMTGIFDNTNQEDIDFKKYKEEMEKFQEEQKKESEANKRKKEESTANAKSYNSVKKIKKNYMSLEDGAIPNHWLKVTDNELMEPVLFVEAGEEMTPLEIKNLIELNRIEFKITSEITKLKANDDKVIVRFSDAKQRDFFKKEIKKINKKIEAYVPEPFEPMIRLHNLPKELDVNTFIEDIKKYNNFNKKDKIEHHSTTSSRNPNKSDYILRVTPAIRDEVARRRGLLLYRCSKVNVTDYFNIIQCTRCFKYSHTKFFCGSQSKCKYCSQYHLSHTCESKDKPQNYKCPACDQPGHKAGHKDCPKLQKQLKYATTLVNYHYSYIIM